MYTLLIRFCLAAILIVSLSLVAFQVFTTLSEDHDGWSLFAPVRVTTDPLTVDPINLLRTDDQETIRDVVRETRTYGVPWSVRVVSEDTIDSTLPAEEWAERSYDDNPVETRDGAADGLLMVVIIPEPDHTETMVEFVTGENFYPKGGITPERLQEIVDVQMAPIIAENSIAEAIIEGATWVEWTQLFRPTPDSPPTTLENGLQNLLHPFGTIGIAGLAIIVLGATAVVVALTWRGTRAVHEGSLSAITAAAADIGRVDTPVIGGVVLDAIDRGSMAIASVSPVTLSASDSVDINHRDQQIRATLEGPEGADQTLSTHMLVDRLKRDGTIRRSVEDDLATNGVYHPKSVLMTIMLRCIAGPGVTFGAIAIVLSVLGESASTLAAGIALTAISLVALIWNEQRSWTTRSGRQALHRWKDQHHDAEDNERVLFEAIVSLDEFRMPGDRRVQVREDSYQLIPSLRS